MKAGVQQFTPLRFSTVYVWWAVVIFMLLFFIFSCSKEPEGSSKASLGTGSVAFKVRFQGTPGSAAQHHTLELDCAAAGVSTVEAEICDANEIQLASGGPWNCEDHQGTVTGVPTGSNRKAVVLGKDALGNLLYRGEKAGITVNAGQTNSAGEIVANLFCPTLTAPENGSTVTLDDLSFAWSAVAGAEEYKIQISEESGFSSIVEEEYPMAASYTPSDLSAGVEYYWRVCAVSSNVDISAWSETWSFTTSGEGISTLIWDEGKWDEANWE
jgi:hypothetical protein